MTQRPETAETVQQWLSTAGEDLLAAGHLLGIGDTCPHGIVCYHAQQCAEKASNQAASPPPPDRCSGSAGNSCRLPQRLRAPALIDGRTIRKQWRRCRKRVGELLKLGVSQKQAVLTALSRKSYWHLSRTMATQWGMNDAWLQSQGLVSVRNLWIAFHYPAANPSGIRVASR